MSVNISGLSKVDLLERLWNRMKPAAFFAFNLSLAPSFNKDEAKKDVKGYIDYFCGRCIKSDLSGDTANTSLYNRDAGNGAFEEIVKKMQEELKNTKS